MKYDVIQNADGNTSIVSTWVDNLKGATSAFFNQCRLLINDPNVNKATIAIFDEQLNVVDDQKQYIINKVIPLMFTVSFNGHGGSETAEQIVENGELATEPEDPVRPGCIFTGWELDGYPYSFENPVVKDIVLVATWEPEPEPTPEPTEE